MTNKFWKNKKVLITGSDGFIGSHLTEKLIDLGAKVTSVVRGTSVNGTHRYTFKNLDEKYVKKIKKIIACDFSSTDIIQQIVKQNPQYIFHLGASAYVPYSFKYPLEVNQANVIGTLNILEASRQLKNLERVICTSSSEVYGTALKSKIDENHPLNPTSPYAASKVAADRYCYSYINTFSLPITVVRPFNTYGPRHTYDVVPKFIKMALSNENITIHGNGKQSRDLTYVSDAVDAFIAISQSKKANQKVINFGTGKDYDINFLAKHIKKISNSKSKIIHIEDRLAEVQRLTCDPSYCKKITNWNHKVDILKGLKLNIEWAKENWNH
jgi:nucleoside-diphosphate-sugar epimerase|tara:strand:- start:1534 stop:2511 length:978 start_codon:yes stop_codon:yes gene_type:complete